MLPCWRNSGDNWLQRKIAILLTPRSCRKIRAIFTFFPFLVVRTHFILFDGETFATGAKWPDQCSVADWHAYRAVRRDRLPFDSNDSRNCKCICPGGANSTRPTIVCPTIAPSASVHIFARARIHVLQTEALTISSGSFFSTKARDRARASAKSKAIPDYKIVKFQMEFELSSYNDESNLVRYKLYKLK